MKRILFVCTGNTCRSAMAQALMTKTLADKDISGWRAESAGLAARPGDPATREAVLCAAEYGADLSGHRARRVDRELLYAADLILAMTGAHKQALQDIAPEYRGRMFLLTEYARAGRGDVTDPFGRGASAYRACALELHNALLRLSSRLDQ